MLFDEASGFKKKKKKRSFIQKQKRFAKRGNFKPGNQLSPDLYEYFFNIMKVMNSNKDDEEEMSALATNVFHELEGKEVEYCCNQIVSRIIENLLLHLPHEVFFKFLEKFSENLRPIFNDTFGSHVLQQTLIVAFTKYKILENEPDNKLSAAFYDYIIKVSNFLFNNLEDFIWNTYSNAVAKTVLNVLSGHPVKGEIKLKFENLSESEVTLPEEFKSIIKKYAKKILSRPQFDDLCNTPINSSFLQTLLLASKNTEECSELVKRIIVYYESNTPDLTDKENDCFLRLLEVVLCVTDTKSYLKIYKQIFKKNLVQLALSKSGNFAVQKLIINCDREKIFGIIFAILEPHIEEILKVEYSGLLLAVVKGCRKFELFQANCMAMLMRMFQAKDTKELVSLICGLIPSENFNPETSPITLHGCLIVQELLYFKKPIKIVNSLLGMSELKLVTLFSDIRGNHIAEAFAGSPTIGEKSKDRLFKKLKGHYVKLATSKYGSRAMDVIWAASNVQQKVLLAEELKMGESELCSEIFGKVFAKKIHLDNFRRNKDEWIKVQKTLESAEKYFSEIIPPKKIKKS